METAWPPAFTPAARRYWLAEAEGAVRAEERLRAGEVPDDQLFEVAVLATGDEGFAADVLSARLEARARAAAGSGGTSPV